MPQSSTTKLLITGATGTLGQALARVCHTRGLDYALLSRAELDITAPAAIEAALREYRPWAVVNTAGYVRVDEAETDADRCFRENAAGPAALAAACAARSLPLLTFSSDLVFDGQLARPFLETDAPNPLNVYGQSKLRAEQQVLAAHPGALLVRTAAFFSGWDEHNFVFHAIRAGRAGERFAAIDDAVISPTYVPDLVNQSLDLLLDEARGLWHVAGSTACTWAELARAAAEAADLDPGFIEARPLASFGLAAVRPHYSALGSAHGLVLPKLDDALGRCVAELRQEESL